jgi:hypothetical protein
MNESTLTQLKIIVERTVRTVRASASRKRKMREELLAHVSGVFEAEAARFSDDRAALERTALRFGNPAEVTGQLQESVPAGDGIVRLLEGRPEDSALRGALRFAWIEGAIAGVALGAAVIAAGYRSAWSREELITFVSSFEFLPLWLFMPLWLFGITLVTHWMEKSLHGPEPLTGWPRIGLLKLWTSAWAVRAVRVALIVGGLCLLAAACIGGAKWPTHAADWNHFPGLAALLLLGAMAASTVVLAWVLVQTVDERRRRHEEWSRLPLEPYSQS